MIPRLWALVMILLLGVWVVAMAGGGVPPSPNGIEFPRDYKNWRVISV